MNYILLLACALFALPIYADRASRKEQHDKGHVRNRDNDSDDMETQLFNRSVDEEGNERSLITGRKKFRQHHMIRGESERRRDEEYGNPHKRKYREEEERREEEPGRATKKKRYTKKYHEEEGDGRRYSRESEREEY